MGERQRVVGMKEVLAVTTVFTKQGVGSELMYYSSGVLGKSCNNMC
jgi:predicted N-acetyltransferase YhbS